MIEISKIGDAYSCEATPPHTNEPWKTDHALDGRSLLAALRDRGAHPTDIGDAFYAIDPDWIAKLK